MDGALRRRRVRFPSASAELRRRALEAARPSGRSREPGRRVEHDAHSGHGNGDEPDHVRGTSRFGQAWDFEVQAARDQGKPGCGWLRITKSKEDEDSYAVPFHVVMTAAGSLAVRPGHLGASADVDGDWPDDGPPMSAAEASIWNDIIEYVQEHAGESGLSFRRINEGAKGNQALKRQALDQMRRDCLVTETDGPNRSKIYRPGPLLEWIGKAIAG